MAGGKFVPTRSLEPAPGMRILGLDLHDEFQVAQRIHTGFPPSAIGRLADALDLPDTRVLELADIPASTYHSRKRRRKPLSPEESSRVYRIAKAAAAAERFFEGDESAARRWLTTPKVALGGSAPLAFARTPEGSDYVIKLLGRMEHGVVS